MSTVSDINNYQLVTIEEASPHLIREGLFGATFVKNKELLFLRMELLTEENEKIWRQYANMSSWVANDNSRGVLSNLVALAGTDSYPSYEKIKEVSGFTSEEYIEFTKKAIGLKNKCGDKIVNVIKKSSVGSNHMFTQFIPGESHYIVYISKSRTFSIQSADMTNKEFNLKNYIETYNDILISVGSGFSPKDSFHNRGIFRNPYWVFEEKYSGLSMLLHGFSGAVANKFFSEKEFMLVRPVGSMQTLINKNLLPGEGYIEREGEKIDLSKFEVSANASEGPLNYIKVSALTRIYNQIIGSSFSGPVM